jgi:hypothetical protein
MILTSWTLEKSDLMTVKGGWRRIRRLASEVLCGFLLTPAYRCPTDDVGCSNGGEVAIVDLGSEVVCVVLHPQSSPSEIDDSISDPERELHSAIPTDM